MTLDPIIKAKIEQYKKDYYLVDEKDDAIFERYVNDNILSQVQPDVFKTEYELLDQICIGGSDDLGLDGIAISLNGQFIKSCEEVDDILVGSNKGHFEIYFIQSKNKDKFNLGEFMVFADGIENFLEEEISMPYNSEVENWHKIFNYITSQDIIVKWSSLPDIKCFYVVNGIMENIPHIKSHATIVKKRLEQKKIYGDIDFIFIDSKKLLDIININENNYEFFMEKVESISLPEAEQVDNSSIVLCEAGELIKLLSTPDGLLRKNIFDDNVRDFQGDTTINQEIANTITDEPQRFVLLNNGITIVCHEVKEINRKIIMSNPQIVNGCQTCNVLFQNYKKGVDLSNVYVIAKIIGSADTATVNNIVKGTNRQNIVYEEAFEITRDFHKKLEEFFRSFSIEGQKKIYYERRSKQYDNNDQITPLQKVNFRILIQSFVTLFLFKAEIGHKHESRLLSEYKNKIFLDNQSFYQYYLAAYIYLFTEKMFRTKELDKEFCPYKMQIMMIFKELIGGESPDINRRKEIDRYCKNVFRVLADEEKCKAEMERSVELFSAISDDWIAEKGDSFRDGRKDNADFTKFILNKIRTNGYVERNTKNVGKVLLIRRDKHGLYYGFIGRMPDNVFFHENENPGMNPDYEGKLVSYDLIETSRDLHAVNVTFIED